MPKPGVVLPDWAHQYRIVSSEYPPINFFETLVDPDLMDELFHIEGLTNDHLRTETGEIALVAAVLSIVTKESLYRWTAVVGRRVNSPALVANAWHHRSDALSSLPVAVAVAVEEAMK